MNKRRVSVIIGVIGIVVVVLVATFLKVIDINVNKEYEFVVNNIVSVAKDCIEKEICDYNSITLKELYDKNLLEEQINPKTKELFNEKSFVDVPGFIFVLL